MYLLIFNDGNGWELYSICSYPTLKEAEEKVENLSAIHNKWKFIITKIVE